MSDVEEPMARATPGLCVAEMRPAMRTSGVRTWGLIALGVLLLATLYGPSIWGLAERWWKDPSYSHGFLVPFLSALLAWRWMRREQPELGASVAGLGATEVLAGITVHLAAGIVVYPPLDFIGLALVLRGLALVIGGRTWARGLWFPTLFLFFMFPLPAVWTSAAAVWLQDVVAWAASGVLNVLWVCHRQGNAIHLPGLERPLYIAEECSGLRQIVALVALAAFLGAWHPRPVWQRLALVLIALPVAVVVNVIRVLLMAFGARWFGEAWLSGWLHNLPGLLTLPLGLGCLLLAGWALHLWDGFPTRPYSKTGRVGNPSHKYDRDVQRLHG